METPHEARYRWRPGLGNVSTEQVGLVDGNWLARKAEELRAAVAGIDLDQPMQEAVVPLQKATRLQHRLAMVFNENLTVVAIQIDGHEGYEPFALATTDTTRASLEMKPHRVPANPLHRLRRNRPDPSTRRLCQLCRPVFQNFMDCEFPPEIPAATADVEQPV